MLLLRFLVPPLEDLGVLLQCPARLDFDIDLEATHGWLPILRQMIENRHYL